MKITDVKKEALLSLNGNWAKAILINLANILLVYILSKLFQVFIPTNKVLIAISKIILLGIEIPLTFGYTACMMKISNAEDASYFDFITIGIKHIIKVWKVFLLVFIKLLIPMLLIMFLSAVVTFLLNSANVALQVLAFIGSIGIIALMIFYIYKIISFSLVTYVLFEDPESKAIDIIKTSEKLLKGNKFQYIMIYLSFILWFIFLGIIDYLLLSFVPYGQLFAIIISLVAFLILDTYITFSIIEFYKDLKN